MDNNTRKILSYKTGQLLFESIKFSGNELQNIAFHNERLNRTRWEIFGLLDSLNLLDFIRIPENLDNEIYKCRVLYAEKIEKIEFEKYMPKIIKSLRITEYDDIEYKYKDCDRSVINDLLKQRGNSDDILIIKKGLVTDTSFANIIFWDGKNWLTPSTPLLVGTARTRLLKENRIQEKEIKRSDLTQFTKARIINAMIDIDDPFAEDIPIDNIS